jgi:hypothetical protein
LITLGIRHENGYTVLVGTNYDDALSGHVARTAEVRVGTGNVEPKLRALARFLVTGKQSWELSSDAPPMASQPIRWPAIPMGAIAVAALWGGLYFLASDNSPNLSTTVGAATLVTGGAIAGVTAIWFANRSADKRIPKTALLSPRRSGATVSLGWSF